MECTADFVLKVNEIYHDIEGEAYADKHPEIFIDEEKRWRTAGERFIADESEKINLLDIGSGTGFVPQQIAGFLKKNDLCVCSDISSNMLDVCKNNISNMNLKCNCMYQKLSGNEFGLESNHFNYITMNSVLHHIPDFAGFFKEIDRLLQVQGRLIIGHEPNHLFHTHKFLWLNSRINYILRNPKTYLTYKLRKHKLLKESNSIANNHKTACKSNDLHDQVNSRLMQMGVITKALPPKKIGEIVDYHSPTAGGFHKDRGINIAEMRTKYLANYELEYLETYNHLGRTNYQNFFTKACDSILKTIFPKRGATFFIVLKKIA